MSLRAYVLLVVLLAVLVAGFSYLRALGRRIFFETPPREEAARTQLSEVALQSASAPNQSVTLYFLSFDKKQLVAETRQIAMATGDTDRIRQILLALIEGSHLGYSRPLPPSTEVRAVFLTPEGTAYVDFSNDALTNFTPGITSETLALYSIVNSLAANVPEVKRVKVLINGQEVETLDGHADLTNYFVPDPSRILQ